MSQFKPQDIITNDGFTEALFHLTLEEFTQRMNQTGAVISHSQSRGEEEYVVDHNGTALTFSLCETDDVDSIQTDYDLEDFVESSSEVDSPNIFIISQADKETVKEFFTTSPWIVN